MISYIRIHRIDAMLLKDIVGQESVKNRLIQSVKDNRVSHAQLFLGSEGSGNLALAIAYAQYIACTNKQAEDSCDTCPSCIKYNKLVHPDLHFAFPITTSKDAKVSTVLLPEWREAITENPYINLFQWYEHLGVENKQGIIGVEESAEILRKLSLMSYESEFKTMIIWAPEKMHLSAANKLLKILEEPPDKTLFILVTENEDQLLRTIISRTQLVKINKLSDTEIKTALITKHQLAEQDAARIAYLADGNYNHALALMKESDSENFNFNTFSGWMRLCFRNDVLKITTWANEMSSIGRERQKNFLAYGLNAFRECLIMNYGDQSIIRIEGEELEFVKKFAPFINGGNCEELVAAFEKASLHIERNANPKILFLDLSIRCIDLLKKSPTPALPNRVSP